MYTVKMEKECGCFKRSDFPAVQTFENKDDALMEATEMANDMNETFCKKHLFSVIEDGDSFIISVAMND